MKSHCGVFDVNNTHYLDAGNTRLKVWVCNSASEVIDDAVVSHQGRMREAIIQLSATGIERPSIVLGTTVLGAESEAALKEAIKEVWGCSVRFAKTQRQQCGIVNAYGNQYASLGSDRWLALLGYGGIPAGKSFACVVDCGSAVTIDLLAEGGEHIGGYILPGLAMMAATLLQRTSGVRFGEVDHDGVSPGKNTGEAVTHGAMKAITALIDRVVSERGADLVLTGGDAARVAEFLSVPCSQEPLLLLRGLQRYFAEAGIS